jgi:hypothetical protein
MHKWVVTMLIELTVDKQYASVADDYRLEHRAPVVGTVDIPRCCPVSLMLSGAFVGVPSNGG